MKIILLNLLLFFSSTNVWAAANCQALFNKPTQYEYNGEPLPLSLEVDPQTILELNRFAAEGDAIKYVQTIRILEKKLRDWSERIGNHERSYLFELRQRFKKFKFLIKVDTYEAVGQYADVFKAVELNYFELNQYFTQHLAHDKLRYGWEREKRFKELGEAYGEYKNVRRYLEEEAAKVVPPSANQATIFHNRAQEVLDALELRRLLAERFPDLKALDSPLLKSPSIQEIEAFFRSHPEPLKYKLQRDLWEERKLGIWLTILTTWPLKFVQDFYMSVVPEKFRDGLNNLNRAAFNSRVGRTYVPVIIRIEDARPSVRLGLFQTAIARFDATKKGDEFLETYARYVDMDNNQSWKSLKGKVETSSKRPEDYIYKSILTRMNDAEKKVVEKDLGLLTAIETPSLLEQYAFWMGPLAIGVGSWAWWNYVH